MCVYSPVLQPGGCKRGTVQRAGEPPYASLHASRPQHFAPLRGACGQTCFWVRFAVSAAVKQWSGRATSPSEARVLWRAAPGCISCRRCAHILLGFLHEIAGPDDLLIFLPPQAQDKRDPLCGSDVRDRMLPYHD
eukprot:scaffold56181_cov100-Phaeocystis_antarctica.AAC.1